MPVRDLVEKYEGRLTDADRRLLRVLLANPRETALLSTNDLADRASVHPTTAVRFARKLGFAGYPELRARLQNDLFGVSEAADRVRQRIETLGKNSVLRAFVDSEIRALDALPGQVTDVALKDAASAIARARQVLLFGLGHSAALCSLMETRLNRSGYSTHILKLAPRDLAARLRQLGKQNVLIVFSLNVVEPRVPKIIEHAKRVGAVTIMISDLIGPAAKPEPDVMLAATRGAIGEARSLTVPMAICNMLVLLVSQMDRGRSIKSLEQIAELHRELERPA